MANYEDYPVTLTCRSRLTLIPLIRDKIRNTPREESFRNTCFGWLLDLDQSQENCIPVHYFSCLQVESLVGGTEIVPFTYRLGDFEIQFRREEFCLVMGLRFGVDFSSKFAGGPIPFRRRVFKSCRDGKPITAGMLLQKIKSEEFDTMNDHDVVGLCLLGVLELVLLGHEIRYTVPDWCFRLVDNIKAWNMYPWGSYVWPTLYEQLRDAIRKRWEAHFVTEREPDSGPPKYSLMGFTWAFK
ncbi:phospholipase-like protein, partial [Tanacetum coccineum]